MVVLKNGKFIILADLHLDDYPDYRMTPTYRTDQFLTLATDIRDYCLKNDIKTIILAGDTINRAVNAPEVQHLLKKFLILISNNGTIQILHVCGQHDYNCKVSKAKFESTYMNLYPEYTTYVGDGQVISYNNFTIATRDWVPDSEADTSFITTPVDLFIGHVTNMPPFGQTINHSKFKLAIVGDIHQQGQYENVINLGTPFYHHRLDEEMDGRFAVVDLTDSSKSIEDCISFHKIDPTGKKYLKIYTVSEKPAKGKEFDSETNTYWQYIPPIIDSNDQSDVTKLSDKLLTNDQIRSYIDSTFEKDEELKAVHTNVVTNVDLTDTKIDLNFRLVSLKIENYRSVRSLFYEFGKTTAVIGAFGSGKSTFINAMKLALTMTKIPESSVSRWADYGEINLVIEYQGNLYTLCVSTGPFAFAINGEWQTCAAKMREKMAKDMLPFLNYTDIFIFTTEDSQLLGKMNEDRKSEILSKLYNINILNAFYDKAAELLYNLNQTIGKLNTKHTAIDARLQQVISSIPEEYKDKSYSDLTKLITNKKLRLDKLNKNYSALYKSNDLRIKRTALEQSLAKANEDLVKLRLEQSQLKSKYDDFNQKKSGYEKLVNDVNYRTNLGSQVKAKYDLCVTLYNELETLKTNYTKSCESLNQAKCPNCDRPLTELQVAEKRSALDTTFNNQYSIKLTQYNAQMQEYEKLNAEYSLIKDSDVDITNTKMLLDEGTKVVKRYAELTTLINSKVETINSETVSIDNIKKVEETEKTEWYDIDLPDDLQVYSAEISNLNVELDKLNRICTDVKSGLEYGEKLKSINSELATHKASQRAYQKYLASTSNTSELYRSILQLITDKFSCEQYKMTVETYVSRNQQRLSISMKYLNGNYYFDYADCSTAQKCFCDIYFLSNLLKNSGVLIMDEYFKSVPSDAMITMMEILKTLNNNNLVFSSHHDNLIVEGDVLKFDLIDNETQITKL